MNKTQLWLQGFLYTVIASLTPVYAVIASDMVLTTRAIWAVIIGGIIAGATSLKAFLSTTFSDSRDPEKPKEVVIKQPATDPVPTTETAKTEAPPVPRVVRVPRVIKKTPVNVKRR